MTINEYMDEILHRQDRQSRWKFEDGRTVSGDVGYMIEGIQYFVAELKRRSTLDLDHLDFG